MKEDETTFYDLGGGIALFIPRVIVEVIEGGVTVEIEPAYDVMRRRVIARSVHVRAVDGSEVTSTSLHSVRLKEVLRLATLEGIRVNEADWPDLYFGPSHPIPLTPEDAADLRARGPVRETIESVALLYRIAEIAGDAPVRAVQNAFNIPRGTAASWVVRARAAGYLEEPLLFTDGEPRDGLDQAAP